MPETGKNGIVAVILPPPAERSVPMANFTKKAIRASFVKLLNEKPLNQITVRDIVDECGVNRNTFYYYYQDLPQLIESIVDEDAQQILQKHPKVESLEECIHAAVNFALENRRAVLHIYNSVNRDIYEQYQWRVCEYVVSTYVDGILGEDPIEPENREIIIEYLKCLSFGVIMGWLEGGMQTDIQQRYQRIFAWKHGDLERLIDRCRKNT